MQILEIREGKRKSLTNNEVQDIIANTKERQEKAKGVRICETYEETEALFTGDFDLSMVKHFKIYKYKLHKEIKEMEHFSAMKMPSCQYEGLFDNIKGDNPCLMESLIHFYKILHYQEINVDISYFNITKTILICGPPGTGKSTLARAAFQRLSIRLTGETYLVELNASKIFTRFYGDTTATLSKILSGLVQLSQTKTILVAIDEIETLFMNRSVVLEKNEPLEGIRIVNSMLLFLDTLKNNKKIFLIFTSNFYSHLDPAFVDRCDIVLMMSLPNEKVAYSILRKIFLKMMKRSLIALENIPQYEPTPSPLIKSVCLSIKNKSPRAIKKLVFQLMPTSKTTIEFICKQIKSMGKRL